MALTIPTEPGTSGGGTVIAVTCPACDRCGQVGHFRAACPHKLGQEEAA